MASTDDLIRRIGNLQRAAASLEPGPEERRALREAVVAHAEGFLDRLSAAPVFESNAATKSSCSTQPYARIHEEELCERQR